jgi:hypothetical protein
MLIIRSASTGLLLAEIWTHAHWSVGLFATFVWLGAEGIGWWMGEINKRLGIE